MDINQYVEALRAMPGGLLVDVRTPEEYAEGHIPGSVNWPLERMSLFELDGDPIYTYCLSGSRSARAAAYLNASGYDGAVNIGGIRDWLGEVVRE